MDRTQLGHPLGAEFQSALRDRVERDDGFRAALVASRLRRKGQEADAAVYDAEAKRLGFTGDVDAILGSLAGGVR